MTPYADTNFFTRLYLQLADTSEALELVEQATRKKASPLPVTWLLRLELINAIQFHVFAGQTGQVRVTPEQAAMALATFREDVSQAEFLRLTPVPFEDLERQFQEMSLRHTARHGFRTYDLLHVASALVLECDTFWSFDSKASKLAHLEGLRVR